MATMAASVAALHVGGSDITGFAARPSTKLTLRVPAAAPRTRHSRCRAVASAVRSQESGSSVAVADTNGQNAEKRSLCGLGSVLVPALAAALVGIAEPAAAAPEMDKLLTPAANSDTISDTYKGWLQNFKIGRAKEQTTSAPPADEANRDEEDSFFSAPFSAPVPTSSQPPASPPITQEKAPAKTPEPASPLLKQDSRETFQNESERAQVAVGDAKKQKTHGFLPLFLSQFLLLVATIGGGYVVITTPESKWRELQVNMNEYTEKALPVVEDSWTKVKPLAVQVQQKAAEFGETAKPYVARAWEVSKPLARQAFEATKPILKAAQTKAAEILQQGKSDK